MCIAVPGQIISINGSEGMLETRGIQSKVNLCLVPEAVVGDYVIVHAGMAIQVLDPDEARGTLELWEELLSDAEGQ